MNNHEKHEDHKGRKDKILNSFVLFVSFVIVRFKAYFFAIVKWHQPRFRLAGLPFSLTKYSVASE